jgi:hypothetical protein
MKRAKHPYPMMGTAALAGSFQGWRQSIWTCEQKRWVSRTGPSGRPNDGLDPAYELVLCRSCFDGRLCPPRASLRLRLSALPSR